ncbi:uncharacterized protein PG986_008887 [Apiospora aurea]|uniref:Uncharacterized protein n=1 Tax=Apiospora aurea TaxID=335848 RepID=A0ABR1Q624_9PEZI
MLKGRPNPGRSLLLSFILLCLCFLTLLYHHHATSFDRPPTSRRHRSRQPQNRRHGLVPPPPPPAWRKRIYTVDDPHAPLTVPKNKGRESMVYLTHIVDHYAALADTTVFFHAARFAWHNDDPDYDAVPTLTRLRLEHVRRAGYVNLRCVWVIGCPEEIRPHLDAEEASRLEAEAGGGTDAGEEGKETPPTTTKAIYKTAFEELLPGVPVPDVVARRPLEDYVRFRDWLLNTPLTDDLSGRVMEFAWHIIFGKESVHCPSAKDCYCNLWGLCGDDMACTDGACEARYTLPALANLPDHWPLLGWQGEDRNFTGPLD